VEGVRDVTMEDLQVERSQTVLLAEGLRYATQLTSLLQSSLSVGQDDAFGCLKVVHEVGERERA